MNLATSFRYELIGKLETNEADTRCMFEVINVTHLFDIGHRSMRSKNGRSDDLVTSQFSTLTKQQVRELYSIYKYDFEAFEYDYQDFMDVAVEGLLPKDGDAEGQKGQNSPNKEQ